MEQSIPSPYDTGARCEPKIWFPDAAAIKAIMRSGDRDDIEDIGNVDFDDEEGKTVCTVHVSRNMDGGFTVHVMPLCDGEEISVEVHE